MKVLLRRRRRRERRKEQGEEDEEDGEEDEEDWDGRGVCNELCWRLTEGGSSSEEAAT